MATPDMEVIKEIPGYRVILKAILKSQIQQLVEQLASTTEEESVILTASVVDGTLCHLGSDSGKVFLEDHEDIKSQFLGFCLKRHHKKKQDKDRQEAQEREEALARSMQAVTPPRYEGMGAGFMQHRSPRYPSPGQNLHPVALSRVSPGGRMRMPGQRHQPYPMTRAPRAPLSYDQQGRSPVQGPGPVPSPMRLPLGNRLAGQVIKIEADEEDKSNESAGDSASVPTPTGANSESSPPPSPSIKPATPSQSQVASDNEDAKSESSTSTIPNEAMDMKFSDTAPPGGLSLDSDLSNIIASTSVADSDMQQPTTPQGLKSEPHTPVVLDPNVNVKLESTVDDSEMELEITGVELGQRQPVQEPVSSQEWMANVQNVMQGASGSPADMAGQQGYSQGPGYSRHDPGNKRQSQVQESLAYMHRYPVHAGDFQAPQDYRQRYPVGKDGIQESQGYTRLGQYPLNEGNTRDPQGYGLIAEGDVQEYDTSDKSYACPMCSKVFSLKPNMRRHIRIIHQGKRPFQCDVCEKAFSTKSNLRSHYLVHLKSAGSLD